VVVIGLVTLYEVFLAGYGLWMARSMQCSLNLLNGVDG
jgi:hypothetical protein